MYTKKKLTNYYMQQLPDDNLVSEKDMTNQMNTPRRVFSSFVIQVFIIYTITNLENGRYYIGYSSSGEEGKNSHASRLEAGIFPIVDLQDDYNDIYDKGLDVNEYIVFNVIKDNYICGEYSPEFVENMRRNYYDEEQSMIWDAFVRGDNLYNNKPAGLLSQVTSTPKAKQKARKARGVIYKGTKYASITRLKEAENFHYDTISRNCDNEKNKDFEWMSEAENNANPVENVPKPVGVLGKNFTSLQSAQFYLQSLKIRTSIRGIKELCEDKTNDDYEYL